MTKRSRLTTLGLLTFIAGVILLFPARVAYRWFAPAEVIVSGISGSIWQGTAREASIAGAYLRELAWRVRPQDLITAKLGYAVTSKLTSGFVEGNVAFGLTGIVTAHDLIGSMPLSVMQPIIGQTGPKGNLSLEFDKVTVANGIPVTVEGVVSLSSFVLPEFPQQSLGSFKIEFAAQDAGVLASVEDTDAVFDLAGTLQLSDKGAYQFLGLIGPTENTPVDVRQVLQQLGPANERGQVELRFEGIL